MDVVFGRPLLGKNDFLHIVNVENEDISILDKAYLKQLLPKEEVIDFLEELSNKKYDGNVEEYVVFLDDENSLWKLSPIKMALHLGCYELVPNLVQNGHVVENIHELHGCILDMKYIWEGGQWKRPSYAISLWEMLLLIKDLPEYVLELLMETSEFLDIDTSAVVTSSYYDGIDPQRLYKMISHKNCGLVDGILICDKSWCFYKGNQSTRMNILKSILAAYLIYVKELADSGNVKEMKKVIPELILSIGDFQVTSVVNESKKLVYSQFECMLKAKQKMVKMLNGYPQAVKLLIAQILMDLAQLISILNEVQNIFDLQNEQIAEIECKEYIELIAMYRTTIIQLVEKYDMEMEDLLSAFILFKSKEKHTIYMNKQISEFYAYIYAVCEFKKITKRSTKIMLKYQNLKFMRLLFQDLGNYLFCSPATETIQRANGNTLNAIVAMLENIDLFEGNPMKSDRFKTEFTKSIEYLLAWGNEELWEHILSKKFIPGNTIWYVVDQVCKNGKYQYVPLLLAYKD